MKECASNVFYCILTNQPVAYIALTGVIVAIIGIVIQRKSWREKNSIEFESEYTGSDVVKEAFKNIAGVTRSQVGSFAKLSNLQSNESKAMSDLLNYWERAATGIRHKVYDDNYLYQVYGGTVISLYRYLSPYIIERRKFKNKPKLFIWFELLALRWTLRNEQEKNQTFITKLVKGQTMIAQYSVANSNKIVLLRKSLDYMTRILNDQYKR